MHRRFCDSARVAKQQAYEREPGMANWPLCMEAFTPRLYAAGTAASIALSLKSLTNTCRAFDHRRNPSPAVGSCTGDPVTRREYVPVASTKTSLFSTVTVPPVPENEVYVCRHIGSFKQVSSHKIAPIPPRRSRQSLAQITWLRANARRWRVAYEREPGMVNWPLCIDSFAPRL